MGKASGKETTVVDPCKTANTVYLTVKMNIWPLYMSVCLSVFLCLFLSAFVRLTLSLSLSVCVCLSLSAIDSRHILRTILLERKSLPTQEISSIRGNTCIESTRASLFSLDAPLCCLPTTPLLFRSRLAPLLHAHLFPRVACNSIPLFACQPFSSYCVREKSDADKS